MAEQSPVLKQILTANCCAGCGLCASLFGDEKVEMRMTGPGFLRPVQLAALTTAEDDLLRETCPGIHLDLSYSQEKSHTIWGPVVRVRTGAATDKTLRHEASSGGVISALLCFLLDQNKVTYAVHTTVSDQSPIRNRTVETSQSSDVVRAAGSRYAPSSPLETLARNLARNEPFVLVGKPCDIAGARALARHDPRVDQSIPYMLSFFCAGVPKLDGTREILSKLGVEEQNVTSFRYRGDGWPGFAVATTRDGQSARMSYADSWGDILSKHTQFRCKICPDGSGGFSDVACGDAWYCDETGYPVFDERQGRSLIVTRTARGEELVQAAIEAGYIEVEDLPIEDIEKMLPSQANRKRMIRSRTFAMRIFKGFRPSYSGLNIREAARVVPLMASVRSFLGTARRLLLRKEP